MLISGRDIARIKASLERRGLSLNSTKEVLLHTTSMERSAKWLNTLEAQRVQSENERVRQKTAEEALRQSVDIQEAQLQFARRKEDICRANQLLFQESDRMKLLHSSMMLSDVLAEREQQIKIKEELHKLEHIRDIKYEELAKHNHARMTEKEAAVRLEVVNRKEQVAAEQLQQLNEAKQRRKDEIEMNRIEGVLLKERNLMFVQEEIERKQLNKQALLNAQSETAKAQAYLDEVKAREREASQREDEKIRMHALGVAQMSALRKKKETEIFQAKQNSRQHLIDVQAAKLWQLKDTEEDRVAQHCRDAEADQNRLVAARESSLSKWKQEISECRNFQVEQQNKDKEAERLNELEAVSYTRATFDSMQQQERQERMDRRLAEQKVARDLQRQIAAKKAGRASDKKIQSTIVRRAKQAMNAEVKEFQSFAEQALCEYANDGKNVIPIIHALKTFHKNKNK